MRIIAEISRIIDTDFPIWVECCFLDAWGAEHIIHEKLPLVIAKADISDANLPCACVIACETIREWKDSSGRNLVTVTTTNPWDIETLHGLHEFDIEKDKLEW